MHACMITYCKFVIMISCMPIFQQIYNLIAVEDRLELIRLRGQKVKGQLTTRPNVWSKPLV